MLDVVDHALAAILILVLPLRGWFAFRALQRATPEHLAAVRQRTYLHGMVTKWALTALVLYQWARLGRERLALGLLPTLTPGAIGVGCGLLLVVTLVVSRTLRASRDPAALAPARARLAHVARLMPRTPAEFRMFVGVALTAGVCEELLFRGYLIFYFAHVSGLLQAALISSAAFGIGHIYQGLRFVAITALVGAFLAAVYLISGSLVLPMLIHTLMDLYAGWIGLRLQSDELGPGAGAA